MKKELNLSILFFCLFLIGCQSSETKMELAALKEELALENENKRTVVNMLEQSDQGNWSFVRDVCSKDYKYYSPSNAAPIDLETHLISWKKYYQSIPNLRHKIEAIYADGNIVIARITVGGNHENTFLGVEPTGKYLEISETLIFRMEAGKVKEFWNDGSMLELLQEIGYTLTPPSKE